MEVSLEEGLRQTIEWFQKVHFEATRAPVTK
jgi:hypothetical protein